MKKLIALFAVFALAALSGAAACDHDKDKTTAAAPDNGAATLREVSLTGYLTDSYCGAANANAKGKGCALDCVKKGAKLQLYSNEKLYNLDKIDSPDSKVGVQVKVTGTLNEATNTIKVASIEQVKQS
ncbi:MAG TPA: hypothetical protein VFT43_07545 [Candidatus Polarisedimenticolia bacterium]|nr:hypothetical protein [Candidatus Polarisedimenticolia bacterium]